jgi:transposase
VRVPIADEQIKVSLFVATLGYSRRTYVAMFLHERQSAWLQGLEGAFRHFGGLTRELLIDNARALVNEHDVQTREVAFNDRFHALCRDWGVTPRACAPYRPRTKGKDERGVGYVKRNAIAGHCFASLEGLQAHLARWMREVADVRVHGTTNEPPSTASGATNEAFWCRWHPIRPSRRSGSDIGGQGEDNEGGNPQGLTQWRA